MKKTSPKKQFIIDLKNDPDYIRHKQNSKWSQEAFSKYIGFYIAASGSYGIVNSQKNIKYVL